MFTWINLFSFRNESLLITVFDNYGRYIVLRILANCLCKINMSTLLNTVIFWADFMYYQKMYPYVYTTRCLLQKIVFYDYLTKFYLFKMDWIFSKQIKWDNDRLKCWLNFFFIFHSSFLHKNKRFNLLLICNYVESNEENWKKMKNISFSKRKISPIFAMKLISPFSIIFARYCLH